MTLLMFNHSEKFVEVFTDSLVATPDEDVAGYQSKVWTLPHLDMIFAVTGTTNVGRVWSETLANIPQLSGVEDVDLAAVELLPSIHAKLTRELGDHGTSTVYLFGIPEGSERVVRYTYRSPNGYQSERAESAEGFAVKPPPRTFTPDPVAEFADVGKLALRLQAENRDGDLDNTVPIGGHLYATTLSKARIETRRVLKFPDWFTTEDPTPTGVEHEGEAHA